MTAAKNKSNLSQCSLFWTRTKQQFQSINLQRSAGSTISKFISGVSSNHSWGKYARAGINTCKAQTFHPHQKRWRKVVFSSLVNFSQSQRDCRSKGWHAPIAALNISEHFGHLGKVLAAGGQKKFGCACSKCSALQCKVGRLDYPAKPDLGMNLQVLIRRNKRIELLKLCR